MSDSEATTAGPGVPYAMGRTDDEYARLRRQAATLEPATRRVLDQLPLAAGMRCLDVGCGPGEVMRLMAERVGPAGLVVGLDVDGRLGRQAIEQLAATGLARFAFVEGDIEKITAIDSAPFDLVYARFVLLHLPDPMTALRQMYRWTRPGGWIVVQDYDFRTIDIHPRFPPLDEFKAVFEGVYRRLGRDLQLGHKLPWFFVESGIGPMDAGDVSGGVGPLEALAGMIQAVYRSVLPLALQFGITTDERCRRFIEETTNLPTDRYFATLGPLMISAWKRKPETEATGS